jgi:hypothetical protein
VEPDVPTGHRWARSVLVVFGPALCVAAAVRLSAAALLSVPRGVALIALIFGVFASLEVLSIAWNIVRGAAQRTDVFRLHLGCARVAPVAVIG